HKPRKRMPRAFELAQDSSAVDGDVSGLPAGNQPNVGKDRERATLQSCQQFADAQFFTNVLKGICRQTFEWIAEGGILGAQITFQMFIRDKIQQTKNTVVLCLFPSKLAGVVGMVQVMPQFVKNQRSHNVFSVRLSSQNG